MDTCYETLARTGPTSGWLALAGLLLVAGGAALLVVRRRLERPPVRGATLAAVAALALAVGVVGAPATARPAGAATCTTPTPAPTTAPTPSTEAPGPSEPAPAPTATTTTTSTTVPGLAPTAQDDAVTAASPATVDVLENDDLGDPTASIVGLAAGPIGEELAVPGGGFRLDADGTAWLVADDPTVGAVFASTYTLANAAGVSEARIILTVEPVVPVPVAAPASAEVVPAP